MFRHHKEYEDEDAKATKELKMSCGNLIRFRRIRSLATVCAKLFQLFGRYPIEEASFEKTDQGELESNYAKEEG